MTPVPTEPQLATSIPWGGSKGGSVSRGLRVLLVEDDRADAELLARLLARNEGGIAELVTVRRLEEALRELAARAFDVVLLDLGLPAASDLLALKRICTARPEVAVIVLSGHADWEGARRAVQAGAQDYLLKDDITAALLARSIRYGIERARIVYSERDLLKETLRGCIHALTSVLALTNPAAFGRALRLKEYVAGTAQKLGIRERWPLEMAAMVSQLGCVHLPAETCERLYRGTSLEPEERRQADCIPAMAGELLAGIPSLESVRAILSRQGSLGRGEKAGSSAAAQTAISAHVLGIAIAFDELDARLGDAREALRSLRELKNALEPAVLRAFIESRMEALAATAAGSYKVRELIPGMVLAEDILTRDGRLLVARGQEVTAGLLSRLRTFCERAEIGEPVKALKPPKAAEADASAPAQEPAATLNQLFRGRLGAPPAPPDQPLPGSPPP